MRTDSVSTVSLVILMMSIGVLHELDVSRRVSRIGFSLAESSLPAQIISD